MQRAPAPATKSKFHCLSRCARACRRWTPWIPTGRYNRTGGWARADPGHTSTGANGYIINSIAARTGHVAWAFGSLTWNVRPPASCAARLLALPGCRRCTLVAAAQACLASSLPRWMQGQLTDSNGVAEQRVWRMRLDQTWCAAQLLQQWGCSAA